MAPLSEASRLALSRLRAYTPPPTSWHSMPLSRRAAVLILLFPDRFGDLRVVLTMRASTLSSYSGHAALPGGKADSEDETPFQVARREAEEEIGLPREESESKEDPSGKPSGEGKGGRRSRLPKGFWVEELCEMPSNLAKTELVVRPCVAFLHNSTKSENGKEGEDGGSVEEFMLPRLDAREVAALFTAPFRNLLFENDLPSPDPNEGGGQQQQKGKVEIGEQEGQTAVPPGKWYSGTWIDWHQQRWRMHNFFVPINDRLVHKPKVAKTEGQQETVDQLEGLSRYRVWGMTARILVDAAKLAYDEEPEYEHNAHFGDEEMIGRLKKLGRLGCRRKPGEVLSRDNSGLRSASHL